MNLRALIESRANAPLTILAKIDRSLKALEIALPYVPPKEAMCHAGIVPQEQCGHCSRLIAAHAALDTLKELLL